MKLELHGTSSADELLARLPSHAPVGPRFESPEVPATGNRKARAISASCQIAVPAACVPIPGAPGLEERIQRSLSASTDPHCGHPAVRQPNRSAPVDVRVSHFALALRGDKVEMRLTSDPGGSAEPRDMLTALQPKDVERQGAVLTRTEAEIEL